VYTTWTELAGGVWQPVTIPFDQLRPNPYFQPPNAKTGAPLDVSEVKAVAFAPHDPMPGRLSIGKLDWGRDAPSMSSPPLRQLARKVLATAD
jgi:hypothetical protein